MMSRVTYMARHRRLLPGLLALAVGVAAMLSFLNTAGAAPAAIVIPDANLEAALREALNKPVGEITLGDMAGLTTLSAAGRGIQDLTGLEHATSLTTLQLAVNQISDVSPLSSLTSLTYLDLAVNQISDLSPLSSLTSLDMLYLSNSQISNFSPLSSLTSLTVLGLAGTQISDLSPLSSLTSLTVLGLSDNQISDVSPLSTLASLNILYLGNNQISDLSPLSSLTSLTLLWLYVNPISDVSPLSSLTSLTNLYLAVNQISDLSPLSSLTSLTVLVLDQNQINDVSPLSSLTSLTWLNLNVNQISDVSPLSSLASLTELYLAVNQIIDISPLSSLTNLTWLQLGGNQISDVSPLVENAGLSAGDTVYLQDNPLSQASLNTYIPQLQARGVTVYFTAPAPSPTPTATPPATPTPSAIATPTPTPPLILPPFTATPTPAPTATPTPTPTPTATPAMPVGLNISGSWLLYLTPQGGAENGLGCFYIYQNGTYIYYSIWPDEWATSVSGNLTGSDLDLTGESLYYGDDIYYSASATTDGNTIAGTYSYTGAYSESGTWRAAKGECKKAKAWVRTVHIPNQGYWLDFYAWDLIPDGITFASVDVAGPHIATISLHSGGPTEYYPWEMHGGPFVETMPTPGATYTFSVGYSDGASEIVTASVRDTLVDFPTPASPADGGIVGVLTPTFSWQPPPCGCQGYYRLWVIDDKGDDMWSTYLSKETTSVVYGFDGTGTPLSTGETYEWRLIAFDEAIAGGPDNNVWVLSSFTLQLPPTPTPTLVPGVSVAGLLLMAGLLLGTGLWTLRRRRRQAGI